MGAELDILRRGARRERGKKKKRTKHYTLYRVNRLCGISRRGGGKKGGEEESQPHNISFTENLARPRRKKKKGKGKRKEKKRKGPRQIAVSTRTEKLERARRRCSTARGGRREGERGRRKKNG